MDEDARKKLENQGITFYYDREKRLERQPKLKPLYDGSLIRERGFFAALKNAPGGKCLLAAIALLLVLVAFLSVFDKRNEDALNGVSFSLAAFAFEDTVYVTVKCDAQKIAAEKNAPQNTARKTETANAPADTPAGAATASMQQAQEVSVLFTAEDESKTVIDKKTVSGVYTGSELLLRVTFTDYDVVKIVAAVTIDGTEKTVSAAVSR